MSIPRVLTLFAAGFLAATLNAQNAMRTHWTPSAIPDQYLVIYKPAATPDEKAAAEEAVKRLCACVLLRRARPRPRRPEP